MSNLLRDVRFGARMFRKNPWFTCAAVTVLALGIGANTAIFSLVNAFLLKPLVIRNPAELVGCYSRDTVKATYRGFSYPDYAELRTNDSANGSAFSSLMAHDMAMVGLSEGDTTRRVFADIVSANYFTTFGVPLFQGRSFTPEEERPASAIPVVIVSYSYWKKTGADPQLLGKGVRINNRIYTVVGIAPAGFTGTTAMISPELYLPLGVYEMAINDFEGVGRALAARSSRDLILVGRLRPGVSQSFLLALAGGVAGLAVAYWSTSALVRSMARLAPIDLVYAAGPDARVLFATIGFCVLSTILFGLGPACSPDGTCSRA